MNRKKGNSQPDAPPRLTREQEVDIFKRIENAQIEVSKYLFRYGFTAECFLDLADKLNKGKERFDRVILDKKIESRERYMKGLIKLCEQLKALHEENDRIFKQLSVKNVRGRKKLDEEFERNTSTLAKLYSRFYFKPKIIGDFCEVVEEYRKRIRELQDKLQADPNDHESTTTLRELLQHAWHTSDGYEITHKLLSDGLEKTRRAEGEIFNNQRVISCAEKRAGRGLSLDDLHLAGIKGWMRAIEEFEYGQGKRFSTCLGRFICKSMDDALAQNAKDIGMPVEALETIGKLMRFKERLNLEYGREPRVEEIAVQLDLPVERIQFYLDWANKRQDLFGTSETFVSIESPCSEHHKAEIRNIPDPNSTPMEEAGFSSTPMEEAGFSMLKEKIQDVLTTLTEREREVLEQRFGLKAGYSRTLEEVGRQFQVTRERIRQIEAKALRESRHPTG